MKWVVAIIAALAIGFMAFMYNVDVSDTGKAPGMTADLGVKDTGQTPKFEIEKAEDMPIPAMGAEALEEGAAALKAAVEEPVTEALDSLAPAAGEEESAEPELAPSAEPAEAEETEGEAPAAPEEAPAQ